MKLQEIAAGIDAHLKRFERDPEINRARVPGRESIRPYFNAGSGTSGSKVRVTYVSFQGSTNITKAEAAHYLAWLDAGNAGRHQEALKDFEEPVGATASTDAYCVDDDFQRGPVLKKVSGKRTPKLVKFTEWTFTYGWQCPVEDVVTDPDEAVRRWREGLVAKAEGLEMRAAELRAKAAKDPVPV